MDMARLLAERDGIHVTVAISPVGAEADLPDGVETIEQIQDPSLFPMMHVAAGLLRKPLESKLRELPHKPSVILVDLYHPWAREVAADLGVPLLLYYVFPCFTILVYRSLRQHGIYDDDDGAADASRMFPVSNAPEYMVSRAHAPGTFDRPGWEEPSPPPPGLFFTASTSSSPISSSSSSMSDLQIWLSQSNKMIGDYEPPPSPTQPSNPHPLVIKAESWRLAEHATHEII